MYHNKIFRKYVSKIVVKKLVVPRIIGKAE